MTTAVERVLQHLSQQRNYALDQFAQLAAQHEDLQEQNQKLQAEHEATKAELDKLKASLPT